MFPGISKTKKEYLCYSFTFVRRSVFLMMKSLKKQFLCFGICRATVGSKININSPFRSNGKTFFRRKFYTSGRGSRRLPVVCRASGCSKQQKANRAERESEHKFLLTGISVYQTKRSTEGEGQSRSYGLLRIRRKYSNQNCSLHIEIFPLKSTDRNRTHKSMPHCFNYKIRNYRSEY